MPILYYIPFKNKPVPQISSASFSSCNVYSTGNSTIYPIFIKPVRRYGPGALLAGLALFLIPLSSQRFFDYNLAAPGPGIVGALTEVAVPAQMERSDFVTVRKFSGQYSVDYRLVLAVAEQESRFDHSALSPRGAAGILQIMPATGKQLVAELNLTDLTHPVQHLRAGIYYLSKLSELFRSATPDERMRLSVAAYNAGPARIYDAQELAAYLGEDPDSWAAVRHVLPLLSRRYASLHAHVWADGRPPHGYFGGWRETVRYVDRVMARYEGYLPAAR
jgi:membrane-bound lytic murein transglycosylase F